MTSPAVNLDNIRAAADRIAGQVVLVPSNTMGIDTRHPGITAHRE